MDVNRRVIVQHGIVQHGSLQLHFVLWSLSLQICGFFFYCNLLYNSLKTSGCWPGSRWTYFLEEHLRFGVWKAGRTSLDYDLWIWIWIRILGKEALMTEFIYTRVYVDDGQVGNAEYGLGLWIRLRNFLDNFTLGHG